MKRALRVYTEGQPGRWEALCFDFDLAVQGESREEVRQKLDLAIGEYMDYVHSLPVEEQGAFLNRSVPRLVIWSIAWRLLKSWVSGRLGSDGTERIYTTRPSPA